MAIYKIGFSTIAENTKKGWEIIETDSPLTLVEDAKNYVSNICGDYTLSRTFVTIYKMDANNPKRANFYYMQHGKLGAIYSQYSKKWDSL